MWGWRPLTMRKYVVRLLTSLNNLCPLILINNTVSSLTCIPCILSTSRRSASASYGYVVPDNHLCCMHCGSRRLTFQCQYGGVRLCDPRRRVSSIVLTGIPNLTCFKYGNVGVVTPLGVGLRTSFE